MTRQHTTLRMNIMMQIAMSINMMKINMMMNAKKRVKVNMVMKV